MEIIIEDFLDKIDLFVKDGLHFLQNQFITNKVNDLNNYLKDSNHLLITFLILFSLYCINFIIKNSSVFFDITTYTGLFLKLFKNCSLIKKQLEKEKKDLAKYASEAMEPHKYEAKYSIKENGLSANIVIKMLEDLVKGDHTKPEEIVKKTGCVYAKKADNDELCGVAAELYSYTDLQYPETCPSLKKIEKNITDFMLKLFHNEKEGEALLTSGGTGSILAAMYTAKNFAKKNNISKPNMIASIKIHTAFDKSAILYGIELIKIPLNSDWTINISKLKSAINENTVMIIGCAIDYPHGLIDDLQTMSDLAVKNNILFHVDACMGGFITCFFDDYKKNTTPYDFRLEGVTSISCDVHKYGMTPKGCSIVMFKNKKVRELIGFGMVGNDGLYSNINALECSRLASSIAGSFAVLIKNGRKVYSDQSKRISTALINIRDTIKKRFPKLKIIGNPEVSIFAFTGTKIGQIHNELKKKGWTINLLMNPIACMYCITSENIKSLEDGSFERDLAECYTDCYVKNITKQSSMASMYGVAANLPESVLNDNMDIALNCFLDSKEYLISIAK